MGTFTTGGSTEEPPAPATYEFLRILDKNKGGRPKEKTGSSVEPVTPATYEEVGITKKEAHTVTKWE